MDGDRRKREQAAPDAEAIALEATADQVRPTTRAKARQANSSYGTSDAASVSPWDNEREAYEARISGITDRIFMASASKEAEPDVRQGQIGQVADGIFARTGRTGIRGPSEATPEVEVEPARRFPHRDRIESSFGRPLTATAHVGLGAQAACARAGAEAIAVGNTVAFREQSPSLHVAAHEAAHTMQLPGGVRMSRDTPDAALDPYEAHANAVADLVVEGHSAAHLLDANASASRTAEVRRYTPYSKIEIATGTSLGWKHSEDLRVSDDGKMAVEPQSHNLWAEPSLIASSEAQLRALGSYVRLKAGSGQISGHAPNAPTGAIHKLVKVESFHRDQSPADRSAAGGMTINSDCGISARDVMGSRNQAPIANYDDGSTKKRTNASFAPQDFADEIRVRHGLGATIDEAREKYAKMTPTERDQFDRAAGINRYASPIVGHGFSMASENKMSTFHEVPGHATWNFHWAGVVMRSGGDDVTLENYADGTQLPNTDWEFQMYGVPNGTTVPKAGQTFHEQHLDSGTHGSEATTLEVRKK